MSIASDYAEAAAEHRQKLLKRIKELERRTEAQARAITAQSKLIDSIKDLLHTELDVISDGLEERIEVMEAELKSRWVPHLGDRIKNLEAVVFAEGPDVRREDCVP